MTTQPTKKLNVFVTVFFTQRYYEMLSQHTWSMGLLCGWPIALELSTRQLERSESWQGQLQTSAENALIYNVLKHLAY